MRMYTIRQEARVSDLPEFFLRSLVKQGKCPGWYAGNRFYVNHDALIEKLEAESRSNGGMTMGE